MNTEATDHQQRSSVQVTTMDSSRSKAWDLYVQNHPSATLYHKMEWKQVIEKSFGHRTHYLAASRNGSITGVLPIVHIKSRLFGSIMCSMPFLNFGGVCADGEEEEMALLEAASSLLKKLRGDYLELRNLKPSSANLLKTLHKVSMVVDLQPDHEKLWERYSSKHRQTIRKGMKKGLKCISGGLELLPSFYHLLSLNWRDLGTPVYSKKFFLTTLTELGGAVEIFLVNHNDQAVAGAVVGYFKDTVEGMWAVAPRQFVRLQANYVLYWEMIRQACERSYRYFHLGRSTSDSGGVFYKEKWNATPRQLYWEYLLYNRKKIPELNVNNPKYQMAIKTWRCLPLSLTKLAGPFLAKNIP